MRHIAASSASKATHPPHLLAIKRPSFWALLVLFTLIAYAASMLLFSATSTSFTCSWPYDTWRGRPKAASASEVSNLVLHVEPLSTLWEGTDLREMKGAWNRLCFGSPPPADRLRMALFVKKWPVGGVPGGLERHALTLHKALAERGHEVHVYTTSGDGKQPEDMDMSLSAAPAGGRLRLHFFQPRSSTAGGYGNYSEVWEAFVRDNATRPFDVVHTESVALQHWRAREVAAPVAASWHGIAYEIVQTDIVQELVRRPGEARRLEIRQRLERVAEEVRFFSNYNNHVGTSDYVSDVLRTIYQLPSERVHTILNGVDESNFYPDEAKGAAFRARIGVPANATVVLGAAGRLVQDKGHPLLFEAFSQILNESASGVYLLVAGQGPWADRYKELGGNVVVLGPLPPAELADFYNAVDIFVNPTLRAQGLDHTLLEAMQCGRPLLATAFSSITWSVIVQPEFGFTFSPNVPSLVAALRAVVAAGRPALRRMGAACRAYGSQMFTASRMASSYERLFMCMKMPSVYCRYPLPSDVGHCERP